MLPAHKSRFGSSAGRVKGRLLERWQQYFSRQESKCHQSWKYGWEAALWSKVTRGPPPSLQYVLMLVWRPAVSVTGIKPGWPAKEGLGGEKPPNPQCSVTTPERWLVVTLHCGWIALISILKNLAHPSCKTLIENRPQDSPEQEVVSCPLKNTDREGNTGSKWKPSCCSRD